MHVTVIPGVGPATAERLRRVGIHTVAELETVSLDELVRLVGKAHGAGLYAAGPGPGRPAGGGRARGEVGEPGGHLRHRPHRPDADGAPADPAGRRRRRPGCASTACPAARSRSRSGCTTSRPSTARRRWPRPPTRPATIARLARALLADLDTSGGVRLLGVGVSGLADWVQEDLFGETTDAEDDEEPSRAPRAAPAPRRRRPALGARHGRGPRRDGPRLGVGLGSRRGDRALRDRRDPGRTGPVVRRGRPSAAAVGSASTR